MSNEFCTPLDITQVERNFGELDPAMSAAEAGVEANRCLFCYDAPCMHACPTHIDVPSFIKKIATDNLRGSARVIFDANPIGATCARVCPVEVLCEGACVEKTLLQKPIEIGRLQRFATDHAMASERPLFEKGESNGRSVGIIGSGPAGLSCAMYLTRLGYDVSVYEKREKPGGLDTYGMAEYKMSQEVSLAEVEQIQKLGVKFRLNTIVSGSGVSDGSTIVFEQLMSLHDAIFVAIGLGSANEMQIPGEKTAGVIDALAFIEKIKTRDWENIPLGRNVVVIGGGNTAVDAATQAKRLGAERVYMAYRRTETEASAYEYEIELAKKDGIELLWESAPTEIGGDDHVSAIKFVKPNGDIVEIACDMVIKAIGQQKMRSFFTDVAKVETDEKGRVIVNGQMQTSDPKIFAGGDCANGGAEAVDAAQMGKLAAQGIHNRLTGETVKFAGNL